MSLHLKKAGLLCLFALPLLLSACRPSQALQPDELQTYVESIVTPVASLEAAVSSLKAQGFSCTGEQSGQGPFCSRSVHQDLVCKQTQFVQLPLQIAQGSPVRTGIGAVCL